MPKTHINFNPSTKHGHSLTLMLANFDAGLTSLGAVVGAMSTMIDGDGSDAAHFADVKTRYGFETNADAKAAYEQLVEVNDKLTTNASVTNVKNSITQLSKRFG